MKKKTTFSLIFYILGIALGFVLLFPFDGDTQTSMTFGVLSLAIAFLSLVYGLLIMNINMDKANIIVTSKLTPFYKFYLPIIIIEMLVFNTILLTWSFYPENNISLFIALEILLVVWVLFLLPCFRLSHVYIIDGKIIVSNYINTKVFNGRDEKMIRRFLIFFFKVKINKISILILPKFSESANLFIIPKSIQKLKNLT